MYPLLRLVVYWLILPTFGISQESDLRQISLPFQEDARIKKAIQIRQSQRSETFRQIRQSYTLDEAANEILKLPAKDLIEKLQLRSLNATQVLQAYMAKAITVQDKFNCITEFVPFALERAQNLDKLNAVRGPLHGIPVCVKDDHDVIVDTTMGLGKNLNMPASSNSVLTQTLFDLGAVIFCKTNIPQTVFRYSSDINDTEPLFGATEYTMIWNFVDFPAGVIPFGIETGQNIDHYDDAGDAVLRLAKESTKDSIGSPIGIQIIGKPFKEEQVLRALNELFNKIDSKK
ncbi:fatty-acid amide hydrolase 1-like [Bradysia coprophila]|uniref:fatty-acid amide hydrolase 1-like n=1 Tax=Bradysia coprophila TaxID=38358 RepID=UPI00187D757D|nr:fatty-acid amide hydrolase 1-like [Bradysia coprophila]